MVDAVVDITNASVSSAAPALAGTTLTTWRSGHGTATTSPQNLETLIGAAASAAARRLEVINDPSSTQDILLGPIDGGATVTISPGSEYSIPDTAGSKFLLSNFQVQTLSGTALTNVFFLQ